MRHYATPSKRLCWADTAERQHQRDEEQAELRDEAIAKRVNDLMKPGAEYHPFEYFNALEAFEDAPMYMQKALFAFIANSPSLEIHKFINDYWEAFAKTDATYAVDNKDD